MPAMNQRRLARMNAFANQSIIGRLSKRVWEASSLRLQYADGALGRVRKCVSDERIRSRLLEANLEYRSAADGNCHRLHTRQWILLRSIDENTLEYSTDYVERRESIRTGVDDIDSHEFVHLHGDRMLGILRRAPVESHEIGRQAEQPLPVE